MTTFGEENENTQEGDIKSLFPNVFMKTEKDKNTLILF